ncbi:MAG: LacI family DNA-binding transcriptional regulator [Caldilineaceae bacterium]
MKHLTLDDIAKSAGVSPATVSRVINDQVSARSKARDRVLRVIEETGFQPHAAARSLASRRSQVIGLLIAAPAHTVLNHLNFLTLAEVLTQACHEKDHVLSLFLMGNGMSEQEILSKITRPGLVDGLIVRGVGGAESNQLFAQLIKSKVPFISVGRPFQSDGISYVGSDNVMAAHKAVSHLIGRKRTRIALLIGSPAAVYGQERIAGYRQALQEYGMPFDGQLIINTKMAPTYPLMAALLAQRPDAILLETSMIEGVLRALHEAGLRVPTDVAIVGFDDLPLAQTVQPALTVMRQQ